MFSGASPFAHHSRILCLNVFFVFSPLFRRSAEKSGPKKRAKWSWLPPGWLKKQFMGIYRESWVYFCWYWPCLLLHAIPIGSMYGIITYVRWKMATMGNVCKYSLHGSYDMIQKKLCCSQKRDISRSPKTHRNGILIVRLVRVCCWQSR